MMLNDDFPEPDFIRDLDEDLPSNLGGNGTDTEDPFNQLGAIHRSSSTTQQEGKGKKVMSGGKSATGS